ncbi:MAG: HU family DNA-binding protein [Dokdonella sp.]|jgi:nucleoid DNA-binding protein|uniref:HU family DNA-binding protein n=1 Tax=Dokdonella sp. TaxID=2291710 RepID=UPI001B6230EB|nr:HU family DNA-binding protein [Dokdonella sp.]MCC6439253.1 HU family DNA-binding protein [Rhodanobacteraceae bacterium]MBK8122708.1 HU family DNA-binding protein [Dokdonella sp.]MBP6328163.1 HU family DNA-binding protein [Dokdonella sp.]MBP6330441.1 HU family DNA-binding protein [Dokdonella sp.]HNV07804.1 HU family DNA-binding protein [Dokdonella sp.]
MATKKVAKKPAAKKATKPAASKSVKSILSKSELASHLADASGVDGKSVKAVLAALESTVLSAISKKGAQAFVLPGLLKLTAVSVPAKPKRFGKDPFTGAERWFPAKPASTKVKVRPLKKVKDAAA